MASIARKMKRNKIGKVSQNDIMNAAAKTVEERAHKKALDTIKMYLSDLSLAIESTFTEEYGFGKKRLNRLISQLNRRLPDHSQFKVEFQTFDRPKIKGEQFYDLTELLLDLNCTEKCKMKKFQNCRIYQALNRRGIPPYDDKTTECPYKIVPHKGKANLSDVQIKCLINTLKDTYKRKVDENGQKHL